MGRRQKKYAPSWQRTLLKCICVILAVVLTAMIAVTVYIENLFGRLDREGAASVSSSQESGQAIGNGDTINIVLVGTDLSEARSDTTILCTVNRKDKTITLSSFLRDTYVDIPDYFPHKLNTAYALDGFSALDATLSENFGVVADGNVAINFESFIQVVDILGGVEIELTEDEAWYMMNTPWNGLSTEGWDLQAGIQQLNGDQALAYSRIRDVADSDGNAGDFGRTSRQRRVLSKLVDQCKGAGIFKLNQLLNEILPMVSTDLSNADIVATALKLLPMLTDCTIQSQQIPAEGTYHLDWVDQDGGMSVIWVDDWDTNRALLSEITGN